MKRIMFLVAIASLALASCSRELNPNDNSGAIGFTTYTGRAVNNTKALMNDTQLKTTGFGIIASYTGQESFEASAKEPNFMWNQNVTFANNAWTYTPLKYWPNNTGDKISFFAYAPYDNQTATPAIDLSDNTVSGYPTITFTQKADAGEQIDLVAGDAVDQTKIANAVSFNLKHLLSRVGFSAKIDHTIETEGPATYVYITDITLPALAGCYTKGTFTFMAHPNPTDPIGAWSSQDGGVAVDVNPIVNMTAANVPGNPAYTANSILLKQDATATDIFSADSYLYFVPGAAIAKDAFQVSIDYDIITVDTNLNRGYSLTSCTKTVSIPANTTMVMGTAYRYTFVIGLDKIDVEATVEPWDTEVSDTEIL